MLKINNLENRNASDIFTRRVWPVLLAFGESNANNDLQSETPATPVLAFRQTPSLLAFAGTPLRGASDASGAPAMPVGLIFAADGKRAKAMKSIQAIAHDIEWRRMADHDQYYALRDGPRLQRSNTAIATLERYLPDEHVVLARHIASMHGEVHSGFGRGAGEVAERVQGGDGGSARDMRLMRLSELVRALAGYQGAALRVGWDGLACYRGICHGDTQAEMMRRARYPSGSKLTFRRLVQRTLIEMHDHQERRALDIESKIGPISL